MDDKKPTLGLDPPSPRDYDWWRPLLRWSGIPAYVPEGRDTFLSLIPDRYKRSNKEMNYLNKIAELEIQRTRLEDYMIMKIKTRDYHGVADAAMDLREIDAQVVLLKELMGPV